MQESVEVEGTDKSKEEESGDKGKRGDGRGKGDDRKGDINV